MRQECCCYDIFRETSTAQRMIYCKLILVCACHMSFSSFFFTSLSLHPQASIPMYNFIYTATTTTTAAHTKMSKIRSYKIL